MSCSPDGAPPVRHRRRLRRRSRPCARCRDRSLAEDVRLLDPYLRVPDQPSSVREPCHHLQRAHPSAAHRCRRASRLGRPGSRFDRIDWEPTEFSSHPPLKSHARGSGHAVEYFIAWRGPTHRRCRSSLRPCSSVSRSGGSDRVPEGRPSNLSPWCHLGRP